MSANLEISRQGRVLRMALNRPEKRNALNLALCRDLVAALEEAEADDTVGAVLLCGNGKAFCAGMDLSEAREAESSGQGEVHERLFTAGARLRKPIVAAVHGAALAGGTGLVANAHIVVAAGDATFGLTEIRIGLWPFLIFPAVCRAVGERRAVELALTGRTFGAQDGAAYGLVHQVTPEAEPVAAGIAETVGSHSTPAIRLGLQSIGRPLAQARAYRAELMETAEFQQAVRKYLPPPRSAG